MADQYTTYTTKEGDRWDTIAYAAYGDPTKMEPIINANPTVPITAKLPAGITLRVPIVEQQTGVDANLLPPWKR